MEMTISSEQLRKVALEIAHTQKLLEKARGYAEDLQDKELITFYIGHIAKLQTLLDQQQNPY